MRTFVTTCWSGARPIYQPWHIVNVDRMLRKHVTLPFRHVCVTDVPEAMEAAGIEAVPLWPVESAYLPPQTNRHYLNNWVRLGLFDADLMHQTLKIAQHDYLVSIDADIVIRRNVDHLFRETHAFKILSFKNRCHLQGGLIGITPGAISPNPWRVLHDDPVTMDRARSRWGGSDQALLSELFYERTVTGEFPVWNEDDGIAINAQFDHVDWSLFFRTGHKKCWDMRMPEAHEYYAQCDRDPMTDGRAPDPLPPVVDPRLRYHGARGALAYGGIAGLRAFRKLQIDKRKP